MKTKLFMLVLLMAVGMSQSFAFKIIIQGGGTNQRFSSVYIDDKTLVCKGRGSLICPIDAFLKCPDARVRVMSPFEITNHVNELWLEGKKSGSEILDEDLPVSWSTDSDDVITIDINYPEGSYTVDKKAVSYYSNEESTDGK